MILRSNRHFIGATSSSLLCKKIFYFLWHYRDEKESDSVHALIGASFFKPWTSLRGAPASRTVDLQLFVWQQTTRYGTCYQGIFNGNTSHDRRDVAQMKRQSLSNLQHQWKNYADRVTPCFVIVNMVNAYDACMTFQFVKLIQRVI